MNIITQILAVVLNVLRLLSGQPMHGNHGGNSATQPSTGNSATPSAK